MPPNTAKSDYREVARPPAITPLIVWASVAMVEDSTPGVLSFSSNHPMFFYRIDL
jgi:hypothetical protein